MGFVAALLVVNATPTAELRDAVKSTSVDVRGLAVAGPIINKITDVSSGEETSRLTPGGGLSLGNQETKEVVSIPMTSQSARLRGDSGRPDRREGDRYPASYGSIKRLRYMQRLWIQRFRRT